ncbi:isomerase [Corynebacterium bovis]|nr:isomerase [Corynebacterium bovis]RRO82801.1 isomerase [Corynebacterium bovis]RRO82880.1 isomerase [Corynebacterium bovis]RRO95069.1 isomerase [Corynebacterium bovis]RRQ14271.1 isomerase [Corynebacterium bovis]
MKGPGPLAETPSDNSRRRDQALSALQKELKARERREKARPLGVVVATLVVIVVLVGGVIYLTTRDGGDSATEASDAAATSTTDPAEDTKAAAMPKAPLTPYGKTVTCDYTNTGDAAKQVSLPNGKDVPTSGTVKVTFDTSQGQIPMTLDRSTSPCTVNAIEHLVKAGYYNDTVCHRIVESDALNILQCGDPTAKGSGGPGFSFADEFPTNGVKPEDAEKPVTYARGTLAMANSGKDTNGSQLFMVSGDSTLPPKYNVFGTIADKGLQTLDTINDQNKDNAAAKGQGGKPTQEVRITKATADA